MINNSNFFEDISGGYTRKFVEPRRKVDDTR